MKNLLAAILLTFTTSSTHAANDVSCDEVSAVKYMLWREARNQNINVQILVLRVLENRVRDKGTSICEELFRKGAYPYMKYGVKSVPESFCKVHAEVLSSQLYRNSKYLYFNHYPHKFGKKTKKFGGLYFSE